MSEQYDWPDAIKSAVMAAAQVERACGTPMPFVVTIPEDPDARYQVNDVYIRQEYGGIVFGFKAVRLVDVLVVEFDAGGKP